jgi:tetratricopeptide (TPR) repeat protein
VIRWGGPGSRAWAVGLVFLAMLPISNASQDSANRQQPAPGSGSESRNGYIGNEACARCHGAIFESYRRTAMAHASGPAIDALTPADFTHKESGVRYRIYSEDGRAWLGFKRPGDPEVQGKRELLYFIGSGRRGRTYLFETDGFLFESPVNWYANKQIWDTAPAYQSAREIPLNLPAYASCLECHVSGMQPPEKGTENRYPEPPFTQNGVSCERCHGPGAAHASVETATNSVAANSSVVNSAIVNPAKLLPARRDEVCMQCHLEGKVAIERAGRHLYEYRPGDALSDYIRYFVLEKSQDATSIGAVSQVEALAQSQCKKKSGDAMSCTTCHDPHRSPSPEERVSYYRGKCVACHGAAFADKHHADHPDCVSCHMLASPSADVAHTQVTDHRIPRRPEVSPQLLQDANASSLAALPRLVSFPAGEKFDSDGRDFALAWTSLAEGGMKSAEPEARDRLSKAIKQSPNDPSLLSSLGYIEQKRGDADHARSLYEKALAIDPNLIDAQTNLGVIEAQSGEMNDAIRLWIAAFRNAPDRSSIGLNLARAYCAEGKFAEARNYVLRVLEFDPDLAAAKQMRRTLNRTPPDCRP